MVKNQENGTDVLGTNVPDPINIQNVRKWTKRDLAIATQLLIALSSDEDLINHLADFLYGRYSNEQEKQKRAASEADPNQTKMFK